MREVRISGELVLVVATGDKRIWVHDRRTGMNLLIPITNFYNELMLHKGIRDPNVALAPGLFFGSLPTFTDEELRAAFVAYNKLMKKVDLIPQDEPSPERGLGLWFRRFLRRGVH